MNEWNKKGRKKWFFDPLPPSYNFSLNSFYIFNVCHITTSILRISFNISACFMSAGHLLELDDMVVEVRIHFFLDCICFPPSIHNIAAHYWCLINICWLTYNYKNYYHKYLQIEFRIKLIFWMAEFTLTCVTSSYRFQSMEIWNKAFV